MEAINIISKYCWCNSTNNASNIGESIRINAYNNENEGSEDTKWSLIPTNQWKIVKRKTLPRIDYRLKKLLKLIKWGKLTAFCYSKSKSKGEFGNIAGRKSDYIGVSKNNHQWQALINVSNVKWYIGTYATQKEAAIAYDFYSISVRGNKAKTNFDYSVEVF